MDLRTDDGIEEIRIEQVRPHEFGRVRHSFGHRVEEPAIRVGNCWHCAQDHCRYVFLHRSDDTDGDVDLVEFGAADQHPDPTSTGFVGLLGSRPRCVRHEFGDHVEQFVDDPGLAF
jgi:hypothetical protein